MKLLKLTREYFENNFGRIIILVFGWRVILFVIFFLSLLVPLNSQNFLGGGFDNYQRYPAFFSWANFDGEHYLSIAQRGYSDLNHSFFPLYPLLIYISSLGSDNLLILTVTGILISFICFVASLAILYKLIRLDYSRAIAFLGILLLLIFPTSFYFGAVYTESLFLLLTVGSFFLARRGNWWLSAILGILGSLTRVSGILLFPALLVEWYLQKSPKRNLLPIILIPLGSISYMLYLYLATGNPFAFYNELSNFGEQRQGQFVLFPQVFYRYIKILITPDLNLLTIWTTLIEAASAVLTLLLIVIGFYKKIRKSYLLYSFLSFMVPSFTGSFSSLPRYIIVLFPLYIIIAILISNKSSILKLLVFIFLLTLFIIELSLFLRGYWVA